MEMENTKRARGSTNRAFTIFYLFVGIQGAVGIFIEKPENTVALFNENTTFKCETNNSGTLKWDTFGKDSSKEILWNGYSLNPEACPCPCCHVDKKQTLGKSNLDITARKETAKHYLCTEPGSLEIASASLIVIESALKCTSSEASNDVTTLVCAIGFFGEWTPSIRWSRSDGGKVNEPIVSVENGKVTSTLTTPLKLDSTPTEVTPTVSLDTDYTTTVPLQPLPVYFNASVYFNETDRPTEVTAMNVPSYTDEWISPAFKGEDTEVEDPPGGSGAVVAAAVVGAIVVGTAVGGGVYYALHGRDSRKTKKDPEDEENRLKLRESKPI